MTIIQHDEIIDHKSQCTTVSNQQFYSITLLHIQGGAKLTVIA